jgi:DNA polymerase III delta prime subunit
MNINQLPIHQNIQDKLDYFHKNNKIPNIIIYGSSGTGKKTIIHNFLHKIYNGDKQKIKTNVMFVNCAHGKGIKFIREELKFFAKTNIQSNSGVPFKSIVLFNADYLTIDAQSALRRCIELFSFTTRFFIVVENKHRLLNPILSRFCEICVPEYIDENGNTINLHQYNLNKKFDFSEYENSKKEWLNEHMKNTICIQDMNHNHLLDLVNTMYENGYSCIDLIDWLKRTKHIKWNDLQKSNIIMHYQSRKSEFRCEKMLLFHLLDILFFRQNSI